MTSDKLRWVFLSPFLLVTVLLWLPGGGDMVVGVMV